MNKLVILFLSIGVVGCTGVDEGDPGSCIVQTTNNGWVCLGDDLTVYQCIDSTEGVMDVVLDADGRASSSWRRGTTCEDALEEQAAQDTDATDSDV